MFELSPKHMAHFYQDCAGLKAAESKRGSIAVNGIDENAETLSRLCGHCRKRAKKGRTGRKSLGSSNPYVWNGLS